MVNKGMLDGGIRAFWPTNPLLHFASGERTEGRKREKEPLNKHKTIKTTFLPALGFKVMCRQQLKQVKSAQKEHILT